MSLLSTLAKVAVGVAVAKGVSGMSKGTRTQQTGRGAGTGSIFGDALSPGGSARSNPGGGSIGDLLGGLAGASGGKSSGGLGDLLGSLTGAGGGKSAGGLGELLGGLAGAGGLGSVLAGGKNSGSQGGLGGLLEGLSQSSRPDGQVPVGAPSGGSLGDLLNQSLDNFGEPVTQPEPQHEATAKVLLRAMLQAAKSDRRIDAEEKKALLGQLGDISEDEMAFVNEILAAPVSIRSLVKDVEPHQASQVYMMSLLGLDLDSKAEAKYLHELAQALNIEPRECNAIHERMGEPKIYS